MIVSSFFIYKGKFLHDHKIDTEIKHLQLEIAVLML